MAFGTLAFDTLQTSDSKNTGTNKTLDTSYVYNGSAKAWANHDASASLDDSFNTSSISDTGTGHYGLNFSSNMNNAHYIMSGSNLGSDTDFATCPTSDGAVVVTDRMDYHFRNMSTANVIDQTHNRVVVHGDLA